MKMLALWWWIDRWRKSTAYTDMSLEEQAAYRNLLDEATLRGGALPANEKVLAKASGDATRWRAVREAVMAKFELRDDGWHNVTLDAVLAKSAYRADKQKRYREGKASPVIQAIVARDGQVCGICALAVEPHKAEIDHIIPASRNGHGTDIRNLQLAHGACNRKKGALSNRRHASLLRHTQGLLQSNEHGNAQLHERSNSLGYPDPDQEHEEHKGRTAPAALLPVEISRKPKASTWKRAIAIAHAVMDEFPDSADWTPEFKARCSAQGIDYGQRGGQTQRALFSRAIDYVEAQRARRAKSVAGAAS